MSNRKQQNMLMGFLLAALLLVILAANMVDEHKLNLTVAKDVTVVEPVQTGVLEQEGDVYYFQMPNITEKNNTFLFYTNHMEVFVYADNRMIYSLTSDESIFGRTPGAMWNIMNLPVGVKEVRVETTPAFPSLGKQDLEFQLGSAIEMQRSVVTHSIIDVCVCLSILLIGIGLFFCWLMVFSKTNEQRELLYLGLFAIIFGVWAFGETQLSVFMYGNRAFWSYMAFTCLMTMCLPFLLFVREFMETEDKYLHRWIAGYIVLETIVAQFLHLTGVTSVKETVLFTIASIVFTMLYLLYAIISGLIKKKNRRKIVANIFGLMALVVTAIVDMGGYFTNVSEANQLGKVGFLAYAVILGVETARVAQERVQENHKAEIYREMAHKDMPTGCYNRNAYSEDTSIGVNLTGVQIITFDLNNLKQRNDTQGHMAGDKYIADAANMIKEIFSGLGKVYRIGGDEFCVLTRYMSEDTILEKRAALKDAIMKYRQDNSDASFGIACGYATFNPEIDKDIEETRHRADISMYENKKEIKAAN